MIVPSWQETFLNLHEAQTPEELWIVLLVPHGIRSSSAWEEPYLLFRHFHLEVPTDAATTALLRASVGVASSAPVGCGPPPAVRHGERGTAVDLGLTSGSGIVRLAALPALAAFEGLDTASKRATADPSEKVRAWAEKASRPNQLSPGKPPEPGADQQPSDAEQPPPGEQPTLF